MTDKADEIINQTAVSSQSTPSVTESKEKKRKTRSPLQIYLSQPSKKNRSESDSESDTDTEIEADSDSDTLSDSSNSNSKMESKSEATPQQIEVTPSKQESHDGSEGVHFLSAPMNPGDIVRVASELKSIMQPEVSELVQSQQQSFRYDLRSDLRSDIRAIVKEAVAEAFKEITEMFKSEISLLITENDSLKRSNAALQQKVSQMESTIDDLEQYSRRNCIRVSGIPERNNENTDDIVLKLAEELDVNLSIAEIDRSHRVGRVTKKNRDIIVKFSTYRSRQKMYSQRKALREHTDPNLRSVFINEDLTAKRSELLYEARRLMRSSKIKAAYSSDGKVFIRDNADSRRIIQNKDALAEYSIITLRETGNTAVAMDTSVKHVVP